MVSVALKISDEFKSKIDRLPWINWSELARQEYLKQEEISQQWEKFEKIVSKSKLTQEQADELSDKANWRLAKRYEELLKKRK